MSLDQYIFNLSNSLMLTLAEKADIDKSISAIYSRILSFFNIEINDLFIFGSYAHDTILSRRVDENSDIDLMIVFNNPNNYKPQTFLDKLRLFTERQYSLSEIHQSSPTIVLELNHIKFELLPAIHLSNQYLIPKKNGGWMLTDPNRINSELCVCDIKNNNMIRPIIRLIKYWNINNNRLLASYDIEKKLIYNMELSYAFFSTYLDYLTLALSIIRNPENSSRINKAVGHIKSASKLEQAGHIPLALETFQRVFPEV